MKLTKKFQSLFLYDLYFLLKNKKVNSIILIFLIFLNLFMLTVDLKMHVNSSDRATDYYNSCLLSKGAKLNQEFQTVFPGIVLFHALFFKLFPNINYLGLKMIGAIYMLVFMLIILFFINKISKKFKISEYKRFLINIALLSISFYLKYGVELYYDNAPLLFLSLIALCMYTNKNIALFFIGVNIGLLVLIKETYILLVPFFIIYLLFKKLKLTENHTGKNVLIILSGLFIPIVLFLIYLIWIGSMGNTMKIYLLHANQLGYENKILAILKNFLFLLPGILFIFLSIQLFLRRKLALIPITWISYLFLFKYLKSGNISIEYAIVTIILGILIFIGIRLKRGISKYNLFLIFIIFAFITPMGSRSRFPALMMSISFMIPIISIYLFQLKLKRFFILAVLPFILLFSYLQIKTIIHPIFNLKPQYVKYSIAKLKGIYDLKDKVNQIEQISIKMNGYITQKEYCLIYSKSSIYYWLAENIIPAIPKVDLETAYSYKWINFNYQYMIEHKQIPNIVFLEAVFDKEDKRNHLITFIRKNYFCVNKLDIFNVYEHSDRKTR